MNGVRKVLTVARGNFLGPILDPAGAFLVFVVPLLIIVVLGLTLSRPPNVAIGVVADRTDPVAARLLGEIESAHTATVHEYKNADKLAFALRRQTIAAGLIVPNHLDAQLRTGTRVDISIVADPAHPYPIAAYTIIAAATDRVGTAYGSAHFTVSNTNASFGDALRAAETVTDGTTLHVSGTNATGTLAANGFNYAALASMLMFMFLNTLTFAGGMVVTRQLGCERRMAATPTRPATILLGDFLGRYVLAAVQGLSILAIGSLAFGVTWGNVGGAIVLVLVFGLVSVGAAELLGSMASKREQVLAIAAPAGLGAAMLGGCIWPLSIVGPTMRTVALAVPHSWALKAAQKLQYGLPLRAVFAPLAVVAAFGVGFTVLAHTRLALRLRGV